MKNKVKIVLLFTALVFFGNAISQVGIGTTTPDISAELDVTSTTKGFLVPRMTHAQKMAIASPVAGLEIWCMDCGSYGEIQVYNGTAWTNIIGGAASFAPASITTSAVTSISGNTATSGGNVLSDGGAVITARGICWSTTINPTTALLTKTTDVGTTGLFTSALSGLSGQTTYYVRAYCTSSAGSTYGAQFSFTTPISAPSLTTVTPIQGQNSTTASGGGNVTSDGGAAITARGICWSTSPNPTTALTTKTTVTGTTGAYTSSVTSLTTVDKFYVRAYATNTVGTSYGNEIILLPFGYPYNGGKVGYILTPADPGYIAGETHGLIVSAANLSACLWLNTVNTITGATSDAIGAGFANTNLIIASQGNTGTYAAKVCRDLNEGGFTDWYLPSKNELVKVYGNQNFYGGFGGVYLWSSTESNEATAAAVYVNSFLNFQKNQINVQARPIRSF